MIHGVSNDVQEFCELVHIFTLTSRGENVLGKTEYVFPPSIVGVKESRNMAPRTLDRVRTSPSTLIDESDSMVHSLVGVAMSTQIPVRSPAVTDDRSAGFDPVTNDGHQRVGGSVRNGNEKDFTGLTFDTAKHPLSFHSVSPVALAPNERALVDFDSLVRTADPLRAALHVIQHRLPAEMGPIRDVDWSDVRIG